MPSFIHHVHAVEPIRRAAEPAAVVGSYDGGHRPKRRVVRGGRQQRLRSLHGDRARQTAADRGRRHTSGQHRARGQVAQRRGLRPL